MTDLSTATGSWEVSARYEPGWERTGFRTKNPGWWSKPSPIFRETPAAQAAYFKRVLVIESPRGWLWREWMKRGLFMAIVACAVGAQVVFAGGAIAAGLRRRTGETVSADQGTFIASWAAALAGLVLCTADLIGIDLGQYGYPM